MGKINVLSFAVANLIAAGEVVDRPSSVIKELLENAIDSGADKITVEIQNGGVTYMRVSDNGCGISPDDLPTAIRRHATSKIKDASDLDGILTLGFRGEALAAIASVSDLRIISKQAEAQTGAMLEASAGNIIGVSDRACTDGTTVIVENLFANVPARRKFLKKDITEAMAVSALTEKIALSRPDIAFKLIVDGNIKLETVGDGQLKTAIYSIFGKEFTSRLIETEMEIDGIRVHGFVGRPDNVRANRNYQNFFINGRYVKTKTALAAVEQAYTSYIASEKFPCCVLFIDINPNAVDVNVHPAKLEVKFSNEKPVFEAIYYSVRNALERDTQRPSVTLGAAVARRVSDSDIPIAEGKAESLKTRQLQTDIYTKKSEGFATMTAREYLMEHSGNSQAKTGVTPVFEQSPTEQIRHMPKQETKSEQVSSPSIQISIKPKLSVPDTNEPKIIQQASPRAENALNEIPVSKTDTEPKRLSYRIVGEVFNFYILVEHEDKILIIDKHAAHERIIFEQLKKRMKGDGGGASQLLMLPLEIMMTSDEIQLLVEYKAEIEAIGFELTAGKYTLNVTAIPEGIGADAVSDMLTVMAERLKSDTGSVALTRDIVFEKALYQASCKAAIKAGREYPPEYIEWIVDKLMELPDITVCPHGRPVAIELSHKNLNYQFERM